MKTFNLPFGIVVETFEDSGSIQSRLHKDKHTTRKQADMIESMILAHACSGVDISDQKYIKGLYDCLQAIANNS